jgi:hypothetical protein
MLPIPLREHMPRAFREQGGPDFDALCTKLDSVFGSLGEEARALQYLYDPARAPAACLEALAEMMAAGLKGYETERQKRQKIAYAVKGHKKRGLWADHAKLIVDSIAGGDSSIFRGYQSDDSIEVGDGLLEAPTNYWSAEGCDGVDLGLGIAEIGSGLEVEVAGNIYIDVDNAALTAAQLAQLVAEFQGDIAPAYFYVHLGYTTGTQFIEYALI